MNPDETKSANPICDNKFVEVIADDSLPPGIARIVQSGSQVAVPDFDVRLGKPQRNDTGTGWVYPVILERRVNP